MPLRSVEAATRDDAIAAAREQFGPSARVVGVRRVRSGGVLGFFATERYVAEVAPDLTNRPAVPPTARQDEPPADFSSPLASAAPARARAAARNGAAAWAAEARRSEDSPAPVRGATPAARSSAPSWQAAPAKRPADEERVSEFASLLAAPQNDAPSPTYGRPTFPRASVPRTGTPAYPAAPLDQDAVAPVDRDADRRVLPADVPDAPSPFTAALARMVAGDREVRQAVEEALVRPGASRPGAEPRPVRPERNEGSAVPSSPAPQEEEPVGDQVIAPSSNMTQTVEVPTPTWAAEPDVVAPSVSSREEAIAEVLRSALAQGHSDEALAGILRKVLDGASPQTALTGPVPPAVVVEDGTLQVGSPAPVVEAVLPVAEPADVVRTVSSESAARYATSEIEAPVMPAAESSAPEVVVPEVVVPEVVVPEVAVPELVVPEVAVPEVVVPEVAVPEPALVLESPSYEAPAYEAFVYEAPAFEVPDFEPVFEASAFEASGYETPAFETPRYDLPVHQAPVTGATMFEVPVFETRAATPDVRPVDPFAPAVPPAPAWVLSPATSMWGPPSMSATLWGEPATPVVAYTPIWAEVAAPDAIEPSLFQERAESIAPEVVADELPVVADELPADDAGSARTEPLVEDAVVEEPVAEDTLVEDAVAEDALVEDALVEAALVEDTAAEELAPLLARTASDPAPMMSFDSTTIMPPLSLLPPLPGSRGRGRPPVPPTPSRRSSASTAAPAAPAAEPATPQTEVTAPASTDDVWAPVSEPASGSLATVTRLPVAPLMAGPEVLQLPERLFDSVPATEVATVSEEPVVTAIATGAIADRLVELGVPRSLLGATFADDVAQRGTYAALTRALALHLPKAPELPNGAGEVLFLVGPGVETLRTAQTLAASLRLDPDRVQWATRGDLAGLAPESSRVTTVGAAMNRRDDAAVAGTVTIVAVDAPMRADAYWTAQMMAIWNPVAVWAVVEATRKPGDVDPWLSRLPQVDAIVVQDADLSVDPAAVLRRVDAPVALIDGARATPHRWASLLCERLENPQT